MKRVYLLVHTATPTCVVDVVIDGEHHVHEWESGRTLAKGLHQFIDEALAGHQQSIETISGIGIFRGPGSFTGLRIGITVANTLAAARQLPIVGVEGDMWSDAACSRLDDAKNDQIVMPYYGAEAHITTPRK